MLTELSPRSRRFRLRRATTGAALAVFVLGAAGLLVAALAVADPPTTFTNSTAITIRTDTPAPPTPATLYPSTIAVSGMTGPVSDVDVRLNGFSHAVANDVDLLLVGPSGASLVLLSDAGGQNSLVIANNATVTFDDSASASVPQSGTISGTVSYRPTDTDAGEPAADSFPAPAPTPGSATTLAAFTGTNPNGTWSLYVVDDATGDTGAIAGGWSVTITTSEVAASTTTVVGSAPNPSTTGTSVTFTATVTSGADPVTSGTVTFTEGPTTLAANVPVNASGVATFSTAALAEGSHVITGTFNGTPTRLTSSGSVTQVVDNATTTPDGDTWCNSGGITVPSAGAGTPYPSRVTVSGAGSAISALTVDLADVAHTTPFDLEVLLVGPAGQNLVLMSDVGGSTAATGVDLTFADSAGGPIPVAGPLAAGTFDPSDDDSDGADAALPPPAPVASGATTLATFNGTNPNGTWRLFVADDASGDSGSIAGGWCLNVSTAQPSTTTVTSSVNPSTIGQPVTFTATVTSGGNPVTTGSVDFTEGATTLAAGVAVDASGKATFTTSTLTEGSHTITATYTGTAAFQPSSGSVTQVVQSPTAEGVKFEDRNANGVKDAAEPGLAGFRMWADYDNDGDLDANEPFDDTDAQGNYVIEDITPPAPGTYRIREKLSSGAGSDGWFCSYPTGATDPGDSVPSFTNGTGGAFGCGWGPIDADDIEDVSGKDFGNYKPGKVIITKVNVDGDQSDAFPFTTQNLGGGSFDLAATSATGQVFDPVTPNAPGGSPTYSVTEGTGAPADKYTLTAIDCDDTDSTESLGTRTATINVSPRETVTCTFTNTRKTGQLTVVKQLVPDDDPGMFDLRIEDEVVVEDAGDGDSGSRVLPTGDYDISELAGAGTSVANYDSKVECDNGQSAVPGTSLANVQVTEDSDITCTFTNTRRTGRLTVVKQLVPEEDPGLFDLRIDDEVVGADASDGDSGSRDLPPGDYTVSELGANGTVLADYSSSISCDNGDSGPGTSLAGVTIESNDDITCTITNTRLATVRITKEVEWAGEPTGAEFDFSPNDALSDNSDPAAADFPLADGATETIVRVQPNDGAEDPSYTVSEMDRAGFRIGGVTCDDDDSEGNTATGVADIVVSAGETVTCTFVNEQINAAILVVKEGPATVFHGDQITYTFTVTNAGSSPISDVTVADDRCAPVVLEQKNNSDGDELLENVGTPDATSSESWVYTCATTVPAAHSDDEEDPIHNTVTASGEDEEGNPVSDSDTHDTDVLHPTIHVDKKLRRGSDPFVDGPIQAHVGDEIDYQFTVTSPPPSDVGLQVEFSDPRCDSGTLTGPVKSGGDDDDLLEPGESWTYQCSHVITANDPDPLPNTAKVTGQVPDTQNPTGTVTDEDSAAVDIFHPAIEIEKTGPATAKVGDALNYTLAVTNTGDSPFAAQEVVVTDPKCQAPPAGPNTAGDATPNQLDRGDKWTYTCNAQTAGQPAGTFVNTAMVTGKDFLAKTVTDTDDFPTVLTPPPAQPGCPLAGTVIVGTDGDDERAGGPLSDVIFGALGDDLLRGLAGADCLYGQGGADRLEGARGRDRLFGGNGQDRLRGGRGRDRLRGHGDDDRLFGGRGRDRIDPGSGSDRVAAGRGNDRVIAAGTVRDRIDCGRGRRDVAIVDALDTTRNCEKVRLRER